MRHEDGIPYSAIEIVRRVVVRPVQPEEVGGWNELMRQHHYLGLRQPGGETIRHVAEVDGQWVALLEWSGAALKTAPRDRYIGWMPEQKWRRLRYVANNTRFLILPGARVPNLASRTLTLSQRRLSADFELVYQHPIVLCETFVDPERFSGTCYRAAGWEMLGETKGFRKNSGTYVEHGKPKTIWVRPLHRKATAWLCAPFDVPQLEGSSAQGPRLTLDRIPIEGGGGLLQVLQTVPDKRKRRGIRHDQVAVLAVAVSAVLAGSRSFVAMADWAQGLSQDLLRRFGTQLSPSRGRYMPPSEPTIRRCLERVDGQVLDDAIGGFLQRVAPDFALAFDGKTARGSGDGPSPPVHLLSMVTHHTVAVVAQRQVDGKKNEITEAAPLLENVDLSGKVVTADAMHTQRETARNLVENKDADYVLTVKGNQPSLKEEVAGVEWGLFPPLHDA